MNEFKDLRKCPFCGHNEYHLVKHLKYDGQIAVNFVTSEKRDPFTPEQLEEKIGVRAYCANCNALLGNTNDGKLSRSVREYIENGGVI